MKVAIIGNGAIGNLLAWRSAQIGLDYTLVTRTGQPLRIACVDNTPINNDCLVKSDEREKNDCLVNQRAWSNMMIEPLVQKTGQPIEADLVILPLKAYDILPSISQLAGTLSQGATIVLLHNGMIDFQEIRARLGGHPAIVATTSYGAYKSTPNNVYLTGKGTMDMGPIPRCETNSDVRSLLGRLLPPCQFHQDVAHALWLKLAINAVINPLTAIERVKNGELLKPQYQQHCYTICQETATVMCAEGYSVEADSLLQNVQRVMTNTAENYSSMYQDVKHQRRTEIDFINGHIVKTARRYNINVPLNEKLWNTLKGLQTS